MNKFQNLTELRESLSLLMKNTKLTQLDVCNEIGMPQSAVSLFLSGKRGLSGDYTLKLASYIESKTGDFSHPSPVEAEAGE